MSAGLGAFAASTVEPAFDAIDHTQLKGEQSAKLLLDYVDEMLADIAANDEENHSVISFSAGIINITIDYSSIDKALQSVGTLSGAINTLKGMLGDLKNLDLSALIKSGRNAWQRSDGDLHLIKQVVEFISDNSGIIAKFLKGDLDLGSLVSSFVTLPTFDIKEIAKAGIFDNLVNKNHAFGEKYEDNAEAQSWTVEEMLNKFARLAVNDTENAYGFFNSPLLPSVNEDNVDVTHSLYAILIDNAQALYDDLAVQPLNADFKQVLGKLGGARYNEVTDEAVIATLDALEKTSTPINNSDYYVTADGHFFRKNSTFYAADLSDTNPIFDLINFDFDFAGFDAASPDGFLARLNGLIYYFMETVLTDEAFAKLVSYGFTDGGNELLDENLTALIKLVLPNCPASFFYSDFDMDSISEANIADMTLDELLVLILTAIFNGTLDDVVVPGNAEYPAQVGITALRQVMTKLVNYVDYDELIYQKNADGTYAYNKFIEGESKAYWLELAETMGIDLAVYYLNNWTNFDVSAAQVLEWKEAGWTWVDFLDEIADWALGYSGSLLATHTEGLACNRGVAEDPYPKADALLNALLDWSFLDEGDDAPSTISTEKFFDVETGLFARIFNFDLGGIVDMLEKNDEETNIFAMPLNQGVIALLKHLLNGIIPGVISDASVDGKSIDAILENDNLGDMAATLLGALNANKDNLLGGEEQTGGVLNVIVENLENFGKSQTYRKVGIDSNIITGSDTVSIGVSNRARGLKSGRLGVADDYYYVNVKDVTADNDVTVNATTATLANDERASIVASGIPNDTLVTVTITYNVTGPDGNEMSAEDMIAYSYIYKDTSEEHVGYDFSGLPAYGPVDVEALNTALDYIRRGGDNYYGSFDFRLCDYKDFEDVRDYARDIVNNPAAYSPDEAAYAAYTLALKFDYIAEHQVTPVTDFVANAVAFLNKAVVADDAEEALKADFEAALAEATRVAAINEEIGAVSVDKLNDTLRDLMKAYKRLVLVGAVTIEEGGEPPVSDVVYGNIDGDESITTADARIALRFAVGLEDLTAEQQKAADVNLDDDVTPADARLILRYCVSLESALPVVEG